MVDWINGKGKPTSAKGQIGYIQRQLRGWHVAADTGLEEGCLYLGGSSYPSYLLHLQTSLGFGFPSSLPDLNKKQNMIKRSKIVSNKPLFFQKQKKTETVKHFFEKKRTRKKLHKMRKMKNEEGRGPNPGKVGTRGRVPGEGRGGFEVLGPGGRGARRVRAQRAKCGGPEEWGPRGVGARRGGGRGFTRQPESPNVRI